MVFPSYFISLLMLVRQININKAIAGSQNLCLMISKGEISNIYLVQEPYRLKNGLIPGLPRDFKIYGTRSSRAIIIAHSKVPLFYSRNSLTNLKMPIKSPKIDLLQIFKQN